MYSIDMLTKKGTLHLVYAREYYDSEEKYDPYFFSYHTIFRNLPLSQLNRLNSKSLKEKVKAFCDKNYKETASNFTGTSKVEMISGDEYYRTYGEVYDLSGYSDDNHLLNDYGQFYQRQFFKYDFDKELTQQVIKENTVR
jgi:hypothetical protein